MEDTQQLTPYHQQEKAYKSLFAINQSMLRAYRYLPITEFKKIWIDQVGKDEKRHYFTLGSMIDALLLHPASFKERYIVMKEGIKVPTELALKCMDQLFFIFSARVGLDKVKQAEETLGDLRADILAAARNPDVNYGKGWKDDTCVAKIQEFEEYWKFKKEHFDKDIVDFETNMSALRAAAVMKENIYTKPYFEEQPGEVLLHCCEITGLELKGLPIKLRPDIGRINLLQKTIEISDLKSTKSHADFQREFTYYGYDGQISFYYDGMTAWKNSAAANAEFKGIRDFELVMPTNVVIDKFAGIPVVYRYKPYHLSQAKYGYSTSQDHVILNVEELDEQTVAKQITVKGWLKCLEEIKWHRDNNKWELPYEVYQHGFIELP